MKRTVYQTDALGFFVYPIEIFDQPLDPGRFSIPFGAHEIAPPPIGDGQVARWVNGNWIVNADYRKDTLYVAATGEQYKIGEATDAGTYDGFGPIPAWLTATKPEPPAPTPDQLEADFSGLVTARLNAWAAERQYDDINSARLAALTPEYAADGTTANAAYGTIWAAAIALMPQVRAGELTPGQAVEQLPALSWAS
jgi:hypothetical protein